MSLKQITLIAFLGISTALLQSCVTAYYPNRLECGNVSLGDAGILGDNESFEFHRYRILYTDVLSARIDRKGGRFYVVVKTRKAKTYSYFTTSEQQATAIYSLIRCKSNL